MRSSLVAVLAAVVVGGAGCGGESRDYRSVVLLAGSAGAAVASGGSVGAVGGTTGMSGATSTSGAGGLGATGGSGGSGNVGAGGIGSGGEAGNPSSDALPCDCAADPTGCQSELASLCLGAHCPPSLDDAMLVTNWPPLGYDIMTGEHSNGEYLECDDGSRSFSFSEHGMLTLFKFDSNGHLAMWLEHGDAGDQLVCAPSTTTTASPSCLPECEMTSDPPPAGSFTLSHQPSNGPTPPCMVDANGDWVAPRFAD